MVQAGTAMKTTALALALISSLAMSCTTTAGVKATLFYDPPGGTAGAPEEITLDYEETFSTSSLATVCALTAVLYGGACWAYLAVPFEADDATALVNARAEAMGLGRCIGVKSMVVVSARAAHGVPGERFVVVRRQDGQVVAPAEARRLCEHQPEPTPPAAATDSGGDS